MFIWKDLLVVFFDETHAALSATEPAGAEIIFFTLLQCLHLSRHSRQSGAILVIAMVITHRSHRLSV